MRVILVILSVGALCGCGDIDGLKPAVSNVTIDPAAFRACVDREAPLAFENAMKKDALALYGYHTDIDNAVISACNPSLGRESVYDNIYTSNADRSYINSAVEAQANAASSKKIGEDAARMKRQAVVDAENEKIEKHDEHRAASAYYACLSQHAKTLALVSAEAADVIAQAALSSCSAERTALVNVVDHYLPSEGFRVAAGLDASFTKNLLLEIMKARVEHSAPNPAPPKSNPNTPI